MSSVNDYCEANCLLQTLIARQIDNYIAGASILKVLLRLLDASFDGGLGGLRLRMQNFGWVLHGVMNVAAAYSHWAYCRQSERLLQSLKFLIIKALQRLKKLVMLTRGSTTTHSALAKLYGFLIRSSSRDTKISNVMSELSMRRKGTE